MSSAGGTEPGGAYIYLEQQRWAAIRRLIEEMLARIDPALVGGVLSPGGLPPGTMIDRGDWSVTANYRPGDLVFSGGAVYVAIAPSLATAPRLPPDTDYWRPLGGTAVPPPPDTFVYLVDADGAYLIDGDGAYLWEPA
jgi:hypothetical protein